MSTTIEDCISLLICCCDRLETELADHARRDDPHKYKQLARQFDGGLAVPSLVIEHEGPAKRRLSLRLRGLQGGERVEISVSEYVVQAAH